MSGDTFAIVEALRAEVPRQIDSILPHAWTPKPKQGRCLPSTRIGIEALAYFGVEAKPQITFVMAGNREWVEWISEGGVLPMPDGSWSVGIDPRDKRPGYNGHLVVRPRRTSRSTMAV